VGRRTQLRGSRVAMVGSQLQASVTVLASSGRAPTLGNLPTMAVCLGEAPPGDVAEREAAERQGIGGS
jgi:hypothetical protein